MGVDTPEIAHSGDEVDQPGGREATIFTKQKLLNKNVTLVYEDKNKFGKYDRLVALIVYDCNKLYNIDLMKTGYARPRYYHLNELIIDENWKKFAKYFKY